MCIKYRRTIAVLKLYRFFTLYRPFNIPNTVSSVSKTSLFIAILLCSVVSLSAQSTFSRQLSGGKSQKTQSESEKSNYVSPHVTAKTIDERFGMADSITVDTIPGNFPDKNILDAYSIANAYNGNMGSPVQSKIFFDRTQKTNFLFSTPYDPYVYAISDLPFYNTKTPYSNITYLSSYPGEQAEDRTKIVLSINANKRTNITGMFDYLYDRGRYMNQANKGLIASLYGSYAGRHYSANGAILFQNFKNYENGGLSNTDYVTNPSAYSQYTSITMPVNLTGAQAGYQSKSLFFNHKYSIGFDKTIQVKKDSVREEFIPVTSFIHTLKVQSDSKRYREMPVDTVFYANTNFKKQVHSDTIAYLSIRNTFAVQMDEKFNRLLQFGLTAFIENEVNRYMNMDKDDKLTYKWEQNTRVGGVLSKNEGQVFRYNFQGNIVIVGPKIGDFELSGRVGGYFTLWKDSVALKAMARIRSTSPSYFWEHFYSNHFNWENDFDKEFQTYLGGSIELPKRHLKLGLQIANNSKYLYFNTKAMPTQANGSVQVVALDANLDIHFNRHFALENKGVYQVSSDQTIIPLPTLSLYNNLYYQTRLFSVLKLQLGVSSHFHTSYYAPAYMPATGQFYIQRTTKIGNYPLASAYANFHLKQTRFFIEYYHMNQSWMSTSDYFSMPNYPLNPTTMKVGISVNFYN